jgi:hypothetical protein
VVLKSSAVALAATIVIGLAVAGCGGGGSLVGTWVNANEGETLVFTADGTLVLTMEDGQVASLTYEARGTGLILGTPAGENTRTLDYSVEDGVLTLTYPGEGTVEYERVGSE